MAEDDKLCRICLSKDDLVSVFSFFDNEQILKMIKFSIDISITRSDAFPKHICSICLDEIKVASNVKRKGMHTEKILKDLIVVNSNGELGEDSVVMIDDNGENEEMEYDENSLIVEDCDNLIEESYAQPLTQKTNNKYLVYEEFPEHPHQPKFYYLPTPSSKKITNTNHFNYNQSLKNFVEEYLENKPNLEIIQIVNEGCIKQIEKILLKNEETQAANESFNVDYLEDDDQNSSPSASNSQIVNVETNNFQRPPTNFGINRGASMNAPTRTATVQNNRTIFINQRPVSSSSRTILTAPPTSQVSRVSRTPIQPVHRVQNIKKNGYLNRK